MSNERSMIDKSRLKLSELRKSILSDGLKKKRRKSKKSSRSKSKSRSKSRLGSTEGRTGIRRRKKSITSKTHGLNSKNSTIVH